ncbi:PREDICTED: ubiquitin carboxyl-terminal hydrolase isozyme L1 [Nanorana parkeri]|uniref:ubiquitin carboxyl-terminal hydrolase isozyme L1 n=1 Tax=Nanorana parkeri TaxID=125878 RepID=UPI000854C455|nr:PREDICTED: ubiquitin carboxyl-terminal hydrolase isozyme L1 [Nanorana parkeri]
MALPPTEINPEMLNKLLEKFGVSNSKFEDVLGLEPSDVKAFTKPVYALLLIFPLTKKHEEFRNEQVKKQKDKKLDSKVYFMKQTLENLSGIVALIHSVANNKDSVSFGDNSSLKNYIGASADASPDERGKLLAKNEALLSDYKSVAAEGFVRPEGGEHCNVMVLVAVNKHIYELDGQNERPIDHGPLSDEHFLENAVKVCKRYTEQAKDEVRFSAVALVKDA